MGGQKKQKYALEIQEIHPNTVYDANLTNFQAPITSKKDIEFDFPRWLLESKDPAWTSKEVRKKQKYAL